MRALVFEGPGVMTLTERPAPTAGSGEVLVRVLASGICGSEVEAYSGQTQKRRAGTVFGHELVVELDGHPGQKFVVDPLSTCGKCDLCLGDRRNLCAQRHLLSLDADGGNQDFIVVAADRLIEWHGATALQGTLVEPAATVLHALDRRVHEGSRVGVLGCGTLGILSVIIAKVLGAGEILAFDPIPARQDAATKAGAGVLLSDGDPLACDLVIDTVGAEASRAAAIRHTANGGDVLLVGLRDARSSLDLSEIISRGIRLSGHYAYTRLDLERAATILAAETGLAAYVQSYSIDAGAEAFDAVRMNPERYIKVALTMEEQPGGQ